MSRILKVSMFQFNTLFKWQTISFLVVLAVNVMISLAVTRLVTLPDSSTAGSIDVVAVIWALVIGIIFFDQSFKYMLSLGVSRRRFFLAGSFSLLLFSVLWALLVTLFAGISLRFTRILVIYDMLYNGQSILSMVVWEITAMLMFAFLGWFIYLVYYVSGRKTRYAIIAAPFVIAPLLVLFNILTDGGLLEAAGRFFTTAFGFSSSIPNPYTGALSMFLMALILGSAVFLLMRRAQIKFS